jgi:hypothetical protein
LTVGFHDPAKSGRRPTAVLNAMAESSYSLSEIRLPLLALCVTALTPSREPARFMPSPQAASLRQRQQLPQSSSVGASPDSPSSTTNPCGVGPSRSKHAAHTSDMRHLTRVGADFRDNLWARPM